MGLFRISLPLNLKLWFQKKIKYIYTIGISVFLTYAYFLISNYGKISDTVVTHIDYSGNPDGYGEKYNLIIALLVNAILLVVLAFIIKNPKYANYPNEITDENRNSVYEKMRYFMAILSIVVSVIFSIITYKAIGYETKKVLLLTISLCVPDFNSTFQIEKIRCITVYKNNNDLISVTLATLWRAFVTRDQSPFRPARAILFYKILKGSSAVKLIKKMNPPLISLLL